MNKVTGKLIDEDGSEYTASKENFDHKNKFLRLYMTLIVILTTYSGNKTNYQIRQLKKLKGEMYYSELLHALQNIKNDKIPGCICVTVYLCLLPRCSCASHLKPIFQQYLHLF